MSKRCVGPNPDGTVSQGQEATCTIYVDSGGHPYIAGDRLRITAASPIGVTSCEGWVDETYYTAAVLSTSGDQCGYRILSGTTRPGAILGTEVISIPNSVPSGTQIQQTVLFCSAPGADGEGVCRAVPNSIPVAGPAAVVTDEVPPVFTGPPPELPALDATSPAGAVATFEVAATDNAPESVTVDCAPASGSTFSIGTTTVICTATDGSGNTATESFQVQVINTFDSLCRVTRADTSNPGIAHSLCVKLQNAGDAAAAGDTNAANGMLNAFANEVEAQGGKAIDAAAAADLEGLAALLTA